MGLNNSSMYYGSVAKFFHWLIFILLVFMLILGYFLSDIAKPYQGMAYNTHKLTGLGILLLMLLRAGWAIGNPKPVLTHYAKRFERVAERLVHLSLYAAIILMPLVGWIGSSAAKKAPAIGNLSLTLPVATSKALSSWSFSVHNTLAIIIIVLVSVHILAALYHHFIKRDQVLLSMMPQSRRH